MPRGRRTNSRREKPLVLVLCEDTGGVEKYLRQTLRTGQSDKITVKVIGLGKDPRRLHSTAKRALKGSIANLPHAQLVFTVFDKDQYTHFEQTLTDIKPETHIHAFVSVPCFEIFFLLHFETTTAPFTSFTDLHNQLKTKPGFSDYTKKTGRVPVVELSDRQDVALANAATVRQSNLRDGSKNPATDIDLLIEYITIAKRDGIAELVNKDDPRFF